MNNNYQDGIWSGLDAAPQIHGTIQDGHYDHSCEGDRKSVTTSNDVENTLQFCNEKTWRINLYL